MIRALPLFLLLFAALPAQAQRQMRESDNAACGTAEMPCRHVDEVRVENADGRISAVAVNLDLPYVVQGNVLLTAGESVTVTLEEEDDGLLAPRLVRYGAESAATAPKPGEIRFTMSPIVRGKVTLVIENQSNQAVDYAALIVRPPSNPDRTSVCTLMPGVAVTEMWSYPVYQFAAWNFIPTTEPGCKMLQ